MRRNLEERRSRVRHPLARAMGRHHYARLEGPRIFSGSANRPLPASPSDRTYYRMHCALRGECASRGRLGFVLARLKNGPRQGLGKTPCPAAQRTSHFLSQAGGRIHGRDVALGFASPDVFIGPAVQRNGRQHVIAHKKDSFSFCWADCRAWLSRYSSTIRADSIRELAVGFSMSAVPPSTESQPVLGSIYFGAAFGR